MSEGTINNNTGLMESGNWNEHNLNSLSRIHCRVNSSSIPGTLFIYLKFHPKIYSDCRSLKNFSDERHAGSLYRWKKVLNVLSIKNKIKC